MNFTTVYVVIDDLLIEFTDQNEEFLSLGSGFKTLGQGSINLFTDKCLKPRQKI